MYQEPQKMSSKKKIELAVLLILIFWGILFIFNYVRYTQSKPLFLAVHTKTEYEDGVVEEYMSLGYTYRSYKRNSITREEFVPFWVLRENPESESDLPKALTDYNIPENPSHRDKFRGLLYYYNIQGELLGTYKCINSSGECEKAFGGYDFYNIINKDPITRLKKQHTLGSIHNKFAFIDDSFPQESKYGDLTYNRIVYLYQFLTDDPVIMAAYADVKESTYDENYEVAAGENNRFIVKSIENGKWGIISISEAGTIEEVLPFEYDSINYDADTSYYIMCKDDSWYVYDLYNKKKVSAESVDVIYDVWRNDNLTYYFKTGRDRTVGTESFVDYSIYRIDGKKFLSGDRITQIVVRSNCVFYLTEKDSTLHFIDYSGEEKYKLKLAFSKVDHDDFSHPAFEIFYEMNGVITFRVYKGRELSYSFDTYSVNTKHWEYNS